jgi:hypothetical protein
METVRGLDQSTPTGVFFDEQTVPSIVAAVERFEQKQHLVTIGACMANAARFSEQQFRQAFGNFVENALAGGGRQQWLPRHEVASELKAELAMRDAAAAPADLASFSSAAT